MASSRAITLRARIILLSLIGTVAICAIFWVASYMSIRESTQRSLQERLLLAEAIGNHVEHEMRGNLALLANFRFLHDIDLTDEDLGPEREALRSIFLSSLFTDGVFLTDVEGVVLAQEPYSFDVSRYVDLAMQQQRPTIGGALQLTSAGETVIVATAPVHDQKGDVQGYIGGVIDPTSYIFQHLIYAIDRHESRYVDLIDANGKVLSSTRPERILQGSDHEAYLANLIEKKEEVVGTCHNCHDAGGGREGQDVIAFAALESVPWGVVVREPTYDAFRSATLLRNRFIWLLVFLVGCGLVYAIGVAQSVVKPIAILREAARRIADGGIDEPIPDLPRDEVGELGCSLEKMRHNLQLSMGEVQAWNRELEVKVAERTVALKKKQEDISSLLQRIITVQEDERKRIARELHDQISQNLIVLLLKLDTLEFAGESPALLASVGKVRALTSATLDEIHLIIRNLRPSVLDDLGLVAAMHWLAEHVLQEFGVFADVIVEGEDRRLAPAIETTLFRVAQETMTNIRRHAKARLATVNMVFAERRVTLTMTDDGCGFDPVAEENVGIAGMRERVSLIRGTVQIVSERGRGTTVTVEVPTDG